MDGHELGQTAIAFARRYTHIVEALLREGMIEKEARAEARATALLMIYQEDGYCPLCGQPYQEEL